MLSRELGRVQTFRLVGEDIALEVSSRPAALAPSRGGAKIAIESWPAELFVTMKTIDGMFEVVLTYKVTIVGDADSMSRDDKKKWKAAVEEDAYKLVQHLTELRERT